MYSVAHSDAFSTRILETVFGVVIQEVYTLYTQPKPPRESIRGPFFGGRGKLSMELVTP